MSDKEEMYLVYDEYQDQFHFEETFESARKRAGICCGTMFDDGGADSGCDVIVYRRLGRIVGTMEVKIEEKWDEERAPEEVIDEEETVDTVEPKLAPPCSC